VDNIGKDDCGHQTQSDTGFQENQDYRQGIQKGERRPENPRYEGRALIVPEKTVGPDGLNVGEGGSEQAQGVGDSKCHCEISAQHVIVGYPGFS